MDSNGYTFSVKDEVIPKINQLIVRSAFATRKILDPSKRKNCFEMFGYDFIID